MNSKKAKKTTVTLGVFIWSLTQPAEDVFDFAALAKHGVKVAWVVDQGRRHQLGQRYLQVATLTLLAVVGQPPAGIKRHTEAVDRLAQQQPLKAELG